MTWSIKSTTWTVYPRLSIKLGCSQSTPHPDRCQTSSQISLQISLKTSWQTSWQTNRKTDKRTRIHITKTCHSSMQTTTPIPKKIWMTILRRKVSKVTGRREVVWTVTCLNGERPTQLWALPSTHWRRRGSLDARIRRAMIWRRFCRSKKSLSKSQLRTLSTSSTWMRPSLAMTS